MSEKGKISEFLLEILVCPEDKSKVTPAPAEKLAEVNAKIAAGSCLQRDGKKVTTAIDGLLIRADGKYGYAIRDTIPIMLIDEGIVLQ